MYVSSEILVSLKFCKITFAGAKRKFEYFLKNYPL